MDEECIVMFAIAVSNNHFRIAEDQCIGTGKEFRCDCPMTCENKGEVDCPDGKCVEGCYCPKMRNPRLRRVQNDKGVCVRIDDCTCKWNGKIYQVRRDVSSPVMLGCSSGWLFFFL